MIYKAIRRKNKEEGYLATEYISREMSMSDIRALIDDERTSVIYGLMKDMNHYLKIIQDGIVVLVEPREFLLKDKGGHFSSLYPEDFYKEYIIDGYWK